MNKPPVKGAGSRNMVAPLSRMYNPTSYRFCNLNLGKKNSNTHTLATRATVLHEQNTSGSGVLAHVVAPLPVWRGVFPVPPHAINPAHKRFPSIIKTLLSPERQNPGNLSPHKKTPTCACTSCSRSC